MKFGNETQVCACFAEQDEVVGKVSLVECRLVLHLLPVVLLSFLLLCKKKLDVEQLTVQETYTRVALFCRARATEGGILESGVKGHDLSAIMLHNKRREDIFDIYMYHLELRKDLYKIKVMKRRLALADWFYVLVYGSLIECHKPTSKNLTYFSVYPLLQLRCRGEKSTRPIADRNTHGQHQCHRELQPCHSR